MRHLLGMLFGVVLAPVIWFLAALGHYRFLDALQRYGDDADRLPMELAFGAMLIVAAGAWLGVLLTSRLSPLAPGAAGLLWLGLGAGFVIDVERVSSLLPDGPTGQQGLFALPLEHGYAFLIGTALMSPLFSPARWRGKSKAAADERTAVPAGYRDEIEPVEVAPPPLESPDRYTRPPRSGFPEDAPHPTAPELNQPASYRTGSHPTYRGGYRESPTGSQRRPDPRLPWEPDDTGARHRPRER